MDVIGLEHCGNSPRMAVVADIVVAWARGDLSGLAGWFAPHVQWQRGGHQVTEGAEAVLAAMTEEPFARLEVHGLLSHGKHAACDGAVERADGAATAFAHHLTFTGAGKNATIAQIRSYAGYEP